MEKKEIPIHPDVRAMVHEILLVEALKMGLLAHTSDLQERKVLIQALQGRVESIEAVLPLGPELTMLAGTGESVPPKKQYTSLVRSLFGLLRS